MRLTVGEFPLLSVRLLVSVALILLSALPNVSASAGYSKTVFLQDLGGAFNKLLEARDKAISSGPQIIQLSPAEKKALTGAILGLPSLHSHQVEELLCNNHWGASQWYDLLQTVVLIKQESEVPLTLSSNQLIATTAIIGAMRGRFGSFPEEYMPQLVQATQKSPLEWLKDMGQHWKQSFDAEAISQLITTEQQRGQILYDQDGDVVMQDADEEMKDTYMAPAETLKHAQLPNLIELRKRELTDEAREVIAYLGDAFEKLLRLRYDKGGDEETLVVTRLHVDALLLAMAAIPHLYCREATQRLAERYWEERQWAHWLTAVAKLQEQRAQGGQECKVTLKLEEMGAINNLLDIYFGWLQGASKEDLNNWYQASRTNTTESLLQQLVTNWGVDGGKINRILKLEGTEEGRLELAREGLQDVMMEELLDLPDYPRIEDVSLETAWTQVPEVPAPPLTEVVQPLPSPCSTQTVDGEAPSPPAGPIVTYSGVQQLATAVNVSAERTYQTVMGVWKSLLHACSRISQLLKQSMADAGESKTLLLSRKKAGHLTTLLLLMPIQKEVLLETYTGSQLSDIVIRVAYVLASLGHAVRQGNGVIGGVQLPMSKAQAAALSSYLTLMEAALQAGSIERHVHNLLVVKHNMADWDRQVRETFGVSQSLERAMFEDILKEHGRDGPLRKVRTTKRKRRARPQKLKRQKQKPKVALVKLQNESLRYQLGLVSALNELLRMIKGVKSESVMIPIEAKRQLHYFVDLMRILPVVLPSLKGGSSSKEGIAAFATFVRVAQSQAIRARKAKPPVKALPAETMRAMVRLLKGFLAFVSESEPLRLYMCVMLNTTRQVLNVIDVLVAQADGTGGLLNASPEQLQAAMAALEDQNMAASAIKQIKGTSTDEEATFEPTPPLSETLVTQAQTLATQMMPSKVPLASISEVVSEGAVEALKHTQHVGEEGSVEMLVRLTEGFAKLSPEEAKEKQEQLKQLTILSVSQLAQETANEAVRDKVGRLVELEPRDTQSVISTSGEGDRTHQAEAEANSLSIISGKELLLPLTVEQDGDGREEDGDEGASLPETVTQSQVLEDMAQGIIAHNTEESLPQVKSQLAEQLARILTKITHAQSGGQLEWLVLDEGEMKFIQSLLNNESLEEQGVSEQDLSIVRRVIEAYDRNKQLEKEQQQRSREQENQIKANAPSSQKAAETAVVTFTPIEVSNALKRVVSCAAGSCHSSTETPNCGAFKCLSFPWTKKHGESKTLDLDNVNEIQAERNLFTHAAKLVEAT